MPADSFRPLITVVTPSADGTSITVTLEHEGWITDGVADVVDGDAMAAACRATCAAVSSLLPEGVEVRFGSLQRLAGDAWTREVVLSSALLHDGDLVEELLGAAWVRSDVQVAAVRAVLDGLTRRLATYLD